MKCQLAMLRILLGEGPGFSLEEKLASDAYSADLVKEIKTSEFNLKYLQQNGFHSPLLFHNKEVLGLKVSQFRLRLALFSPLLFHQN